jgi:hypothetical protein
MQSLPSNKIYSKMCTAALLPVQPPPQVFANSSLKMNTALEYSTRVVQEGGRRCKKSTLNALVNLTPLRIPLMNPPSVCRLPRVLETIV